MNEIEQLPEDAKVITAKEAEKNPVLNSKVEIDNKLKEWLVNYCGETLEPENDEVTVATIVEVMSEQFPEFLMAVAEENWVRGYHQALHDVDESHRMLKKETVEDD
tara:strand:- start:400 stop:717 length:318 start_codon:yes stop_codon:yes gene_type:complete